jgi:multiple sugar transport system permease protein
MAITSMRPDASLFAYPPRVLPTGLAPRLFLDVFVRTPVLTWLRNTLTVAAGATVLCILAGTLSAYALSRFRGRGVTAAAYLILATQMMPPLLLLVPLFILFRAAGLLDRLGGLIIADFAWSLPMSVWMMKAAFDTVPLEVEDAALVDGCTRLGVLWRVVVPIALPGIAAAVIFAFLQTWDEFIFARTFISSNDLWVASVGLASFQGEYVTPWQQVMAAATLFTLPPVLLFLGIQRALVSGIASGAVKG